MYLSKNLQGWSPHHSLTPTCFGMRASKRWSGDLFPATRVSLLVCHWILGAGLAEMLMAREASVPSSGTRTVTCSSEDLGESTYSQMEQIYVRTLITHDKLELLANICLKTCFIIRLSFSLLMWNSWRSLNLPPSILAPPHGDDHRLPQGKL